uniref:O-methyltransferase C-terminal domain-containing protein n=1 Tax=Oryza glumipatula TaxID=40148 RepID=A0A0E0AJB8_9ORYZ
MAEWLRSGGEEETAFEMVHGVGLWGACNRAPELGEHFNDAMAADSRFIMDMAINGSGRQVFDKITSLVDVAGGTGAAARAVAAAFRHIKCTVLDLPHSVLHDWSDEDCIKILKRCKGAIIPSRDAGGKIIIIDVVVGSSSEAICRGTQQMFDLIISVLTPGKERDEEEWCKIFKEAGFTKYKISPVLGFRSIIEVFP